MYTTLVIAFLDSTKRHSPLQSPKELLQTMAITVQTFSNTAGYWLRL